MDLLSTLLERKAVFSMMQTTGRLGVLWAAAHILAR